MINCVHEIVTQKDCYRCRCCGETWGRPEHGVEPGPGSRLYAFLHEMGIPHCEQCKSRAVQMDIWGDANCKDRLEVITKWLRLEAVRAIGRGLMDDKIAELIRSAIGGQ